MTLTAGGEDRVIIKGKDKVIRCLLERNIKCGRKSSALSVVVLLGRTLCPAVRGLAV